MTITHRRDKRGLYTESDHGEREYLSWPDPKPRTVKVGSIVTIYGKPCEVVRLRPFGTIDVVSIDGARAWRISGLSLHGVGK